MLLAPFGLHGYPVNVPVDVSFPRLHSTCDLTIAGVMLLSSDLDNIWVGG